MIPKIIHQVYGIFDDGKPLKDINEFDQSVKKTKKFCKKYGYEYRMWNLKQCEKLIVEKYFHYLILWNDFRYPIQKADFIRYIILYEYGGFYIDCDVYPIQDLESLRNNQEVFTHWNNNKNKLPYNAVMGSSQKNQLFLNIMLLCEKQTYEKQELKIYEKWKGRLIFQTTGERMLKKIVPKSSIFDLMLIHNEKKKYHITADNPYFYDNNRSVWYEEMMKK